MTLEQLTDEAYATMGKLRLMEDDAVWNGDVILVARLDRIWLKANRRFWRRYNRQIARQSELLAEYDLHFLPQNYS